MEVFWNLYFVWFNIGICFVRVVDLWFDRVSRCVVGKGDVEIWWGFIGWYIFGFSIVVSDVGLLYFDYVGNKRSG